MKKISFLIGLLGLANQVFAQKTIEPTLPIYKNVSISHLPTWALGGRSMSAYAVDIDKDRDLDLIIANEHEPNILLLNDGKGKFTDATAERLPHAYHDSEEIAVSDFDGDGDLDIVFASEDDGVHEFYLNNGKGFFKDASDRIPITSHANAVLAIDLDQDGDQDLIFGNAGAEIALINDGKGFFKDESATRLPKHQDTTQDLDAGDIDGDGDLDLVLGNEDGNKLWLNDGKGFFKDVSAEQLPLDGINEETRQATLGDVDGDKDLDIVFANVDFRKGKNRQNRLLINDGKGFFKDETTLRLPKQELHSLDADLADIDRDGDLDLLVANAFGAGFQFFINDGKGFFTEQTQAIFAEKMPLDAIETEVADFNGDGLLDIYICNFRGSDKLLMQEKK
jgi:FG-GAP-like repeat